MTDWRKCPSMQRVEGGIPYCEKNQTACDGCKSGGDRLARALAALCDAEQREKGCVFCNDERHRIREVFDEGTAKIIDAENRYALSVDTSRDAAIFNIFHCPMCGKRLEVEP